MDKTIEDVGAVMEASVAVVVVEEREETTTVTTVNTMVRDVEVVADAEEAAAEVSRRKSRTKMVSSK